MARYGGGGGGGSGVCVLLFKRNTSHAFLSSASVGVMALSPAMVVDIYERVRELLPTRTWVVLGVRVFPLAFIQFICADVFSSHALVR